MVFLTWKSRPFNGIIGYQVIMKNPETIKPNPEQEKEITKSDLPVNVLKEPAPDKENILAAEGADLAEAQAELENAFGNTKSKTVEAGKEAGAEKISSKDFVEAVANKEFFAGRNAPPFFREFISYLGARLPAAISAEEFCVVYQNSLDEFLQQNWQNVRQDVDKGIEYFNNPRKKEEMLEAGILPQDKEERDLTKSAYLEQIASTASEFFPKEFSGKVLQILEADGQKQALESYFEFR